VSPAAAREPGGRRFLPEVVAAVHRNGRPGTIRHVDGHPAAPVMTHRGDPREGDGEHLAGRVCCVNPVPRLRDGHAAGADQAGAGGQQHARGRTTWSKPGGTTGGIARGIFQLARAGPQITGLPPGIGRVRASPPCLVRA